MLAIERVLLAKIKIIGVTLLVTVVDALVMEMLSMDTVTTVIPVDIVQATVGPPPNLAYTVAKLIMYLYSVIHKHTATNLTNTN